MFNNERSHVKVSKGFVSKDWIVEWYIVNKRELDGLIKIYRIV